MRIFRLERIQHVANTGETFRPRRAALLRQYLQQLQARSTA